MNVNSVSVKPWSEIHLYLFITLLLLPILTFAVAAIFWSQMRIFLAIYTITIIMAYILCRLFCNVRYTVNSEYLVKTKGKKIIFKIPVKKIIKIYIGRDLKLAYFSLWLDMICGILECAHTHGTNISIIFRECDILKKEDHRVTDFQIPKLSLKPEELNDCFEHNEILSFRKCMKICKVMGIEPEIVYYKKRKKKSSN